MKTKRFVNSIVATLLSLSFAVPATAAGTPAKARPAAKPATRPTARPAAKPASKPSKPAPRTAATKPKPKPKPKPFKLNLDSYAAYLIDNKQVIGQKDMDQPLPIASVSKVLTTQWALAKLGADFRYEIRTYVTPGSGNGWQVHLASNRHPYFDKRNFGLIMDYLKSKGIHRIERLTFDEGVKFLWDIENKLVVEGEKDMNYPFPNDVIANMRVYKDKNLTIDKIEYWPSRLADPVNGFRATPRTTVRVLKSRSLFETLKDMNRNSNNHVANQIFMSMGGPRAYAQYAHQLFNQRPGQLVMYNGSGAPTYINGVKSYNLATSKIIVQAMSFIEVYMKAHGGLAKVLAVANKHVKNTLQITYAANDILENRLIAKTGSVFEAITLAGVLSTAKGPMAFYFNIDTKTKADWPAARREIRAYLTGMIQAVGPGPEFPH